MSETDRASLYTFLRAHAHALLKADAGWTDAQICQAFGISRNISIQVRQRDLSGGLEAVFYDKKQ